MPLVERGDEGGNALDLLWVVSIHVPRGEGRQDYDQAHPGEGEFQSTPLVERGDRNKLRQLQFVA